MSGHYLLELDEVTAALARSALMARAEHHSAVAKRASVEIDGLPRDQRRTGALKVQEQLAASQRLEDLAARLTARPASGWLDEGDEPPSPGEGPLRVPLEDDEPGYALGPGQIDALLGAADDEDEDDGISV